MTNNKLIKNANISYKHENSWGIYTVNFFQDDAVRDRYDIIFYGNEREAIQSIIDNTRGEKKTIGFSACLIVFTEGMTFESYRLIGFEVIIQLADITIPKSDTPDCYILPFNGFATYEKLNSKRKIERFGAYKN